MSDQKPPISNLKLITFADLSGQTLEQVLKREPPPWPVERVVALLQSIAVVISGLHAQGGAHGALNPRNVRFDSSGRVMLDNFSRFQATEEEPVPADRLTALYLTPEQSFGDKPNAQSDIYSLGALAFELLTGKPLFDGETPEDILHQHRTARVPPVSEVRSELSPEIDKVIARALNRDPRNRFHLVKHFVDGLKRTLPLATPEATPVAPAATPFSEPVAPPLQADVQSSFVQMEAPPTIAKTQSPLLNAAPPGMQQDDEQEDDGEQDKAQLDESVSAPATARPLYSQQDDDFSVATTRPLLNMPQPTQTIPPVPPSVAPPTQPILSPPPAPPVSPAPPTPPTPVASPVIAQSVQVDSVAAPPAVSSRLGTARSAATLQPPVVATDKSEGTQIWTKPVAAPTPEPPRKRGFMGFIVAACVVIAMVVALRMQPPATVAQSNPAEIKRLRREYLEAKPPRLLPMPDEARKSGMLKQVLMTDYMSLLVEQYKSMYLNLFNELDTAKKKADSARLRAEQLEKEVKAGRADLTAKLNAAQAEAVRARREVAAAKQSVDAANRKLTYFQGEYSGLKKQAESSDANALMPQ